jgi:hypothetical protein
LAQRCGIVGRGCRMGFQSRHEEDGRLKSIREFVDNLLHRGVIQQMQKKNGEIAHRTIVSRSRSKKRSVI